MAISTIVAGALVGVAAVAAAPTAPERAAIEKGIKLLSKGATNYTKQRDCFSCHHQALPLMVWEAAARRGFPTDADRAKAQVDHTTEFFAVAGNVKPRSTTTFPYALLGLKAAGQAGSEVSEKLVEELLIRQLDDGSWPEKLDRPPAQGSPFTVTALAIEGIQHYATGAQRKRADAAIQSGKSWLRTAKPTTVEDRAFHLRGLAFAKANAALVTASRNALLKEQRVDGGWSQTEDRESDAYATAVALNGLRSAGVEPSSPAYRKGIHFLLKSQTNEGAWIVETRANPVQVYFDNGDPGGKSQFLSITATAWAVLALLETLPEIAASPRSIGSIGDSTTQPNGAAP